MQQPHEVPRIFKSMDEIDLGKEGNNTNLNVYKGILKNEEEIHAEIDSKKQIKSEEISDIQQMRKEYQSLSMKMDAMMLHMSNMMATHEKEKEERERKWEAEKQENERKWQEKENKWEAERQEWKETKKKWEEERKKTHSEIKSLKSEINLLKSENEKLNSQLHDSWDLSETDCSDSEERGDGISKSAPELRFKNPHNLPPEAKWQERNTLKGIKHTFSPLFGNKYEKETKGQTLRIRAYHSRTRNVEHRLKHDPSLINTRGTPDSLGNLWLGMGDKTALMIAAQRGNDKLVTSLVTNGANVNYLDRDKRTALDYAERNNHDEISRFLKSNGAKNGSELKDAFENVPNNSQSLPMLIKPCR